MSVLAIVSFNGVPAGSNDTPAPIIHGVRLEFSTTGSASTVGLLGGRAAGSLNVVGEFVVFRR